MPSIQIKEVPAPVHLTLRRRALAAGMSLQEYLLQRLTEEASSPTLDEIMERAGGRAGGNVSFVQAARTVRGDRGKV